MSPRIALVLLASAGCLVGSPAHAQEPCGAPADSGPTIEAVTPMVVLEEGGTACACGVFPDRAALEGLRVDGRPVEASVDVFGRVATLRLPPGLALGAHAISGTPEAGYAADERAEFRLVKVSSRFTGRFLGRLFSTPGRRLRLTVRGTEEPVELRVENLDPAILELRGGRVIEVRSSGGRKNQAVVRGRMTGRTGQATVTTALSAPSCPCAGGPPGGLPPERVAELESCLARVVAELRVWFEGRARELARRAERGPLAAAEVVALVDELERRLLRVLATPDLAALRAWVEDELAEERKRWAGTSGRAARSQGARSALAPALHRRTALPRAVRAQHTSSSPFGAVRGRISSLFANLREVSRDLVVDLCIRSDPAVRTAWIQPKRYAEGRRVPQTTHTEFQNLTRGIYVGRVEDPERPAAFEVDLVRRFAVYVSCGLESSAACDDPPRPAGFVCRPEGPPR